MNSIVTLPEIAAKTAEAAGVPVDTAVRFILELFSGAEAAFASGSHSVTIKGVGTFSRRSSEIKFTPDAELAAAVNAPFSLFSAIELPDSVSDNILPEEDMPATPGRQAPIQEEITETEIPESTAQEPAEPSAEDAEDIVQEETEEDTQAENTAMATSMPAEPEVIYVVRRSAWPWVAALIALVAGFGAGYCLGGYRAYENADAATTIVELTPQEIPVNTAAASDTDTIADSVPSDTTHIPTEQKKQKKAPVYDTVSPSRYLTTIARDHYGRKDYWVFIYEANTDRLNHPNRISPGTQVVIPDLGDGAAANPALRARARSLATEIYNRYDM